VQSFHFNNSYVLIAETAVLSNVISNVPAVLVLKPFVLGLVDQNRI
jgi:Na+/H+ antiporter NhaD/arsenite permease-like protein